ncbi:RC-LH1 core complex protein PufX [Phaeovulum vinaykumarii]|uniref:Intrinsic membrane protein PufX n=1 Tax=Phaeovulum vinaykumarii TaxID=407234 RepID=A0A1N7K366_9RHOB|nr:RC-LH1 core complex protein PufX [Phaeovulum vinaykumarii]SIS55884.1 Intrinsic membrane protein PufX [Phaeovulum vinaykumarii]SOB92609.1 intrinsic membrane protein PufX [Phaeovulum vinaykumarii]
MAEKHYLEGATKADMAKLAATEMGKGMGYSAIVFVGVTFFVLFFTFFGSFMSERTREAPYPNTIFPVNVMDGK